MMLRSHGPAALVLLALSAATSDASEPGESVQRAREVTEHIQKSFFDPKSGVYFRSATERRPDYVWLQGVQFSNLVAAARVEPDTYAPLLQKYFTALDAYWDTKVAIPGYEAAPTRGNGNDKYYDDNAWLVITFLEAYESNHDPRFLNRADETLKFVLSGWDEESGGGIWWHQRHKDGTKNACANGPAAVGCLRLARFRKDDAKALIDRARKIVAWTREALQADDGLFDDRRVVATGEVKRGKLTYNSALMLRALLGLYRATGEKEYLDEAKRIGKAADWFLNATTGVYRDAPRYAHFMTEADLELYRTTREGYLIERARKNVDALYDRWKAKPPPDLISNAAIGRVLWLLWETETDAGRAFWQKSDEPDPPAEAAAARPVRVMSFNIRYGTAPDGKNAWPLRKDFLIETIAAFGPDLLGTQETLASQRDDLLRGLKGYEAFAAGRDDGLEAGEMAALFYQSQRFEKLAGGHFWLSETPDRPGTKGWDAALPRIATWVKLKERTAPGGPPVLYLNTHFDHRGTKARLESARLIRRKLGELGTGCRVIVTGDFNAAEGSGPYSALFGPGEAGPSPVIDTFRVAHPERAGDEGTFNSFRAGPTRGVRMDWIACSRDWEVRRSDIDRTARDGRTPSDHYPVTAVLRAAAGRSATGGRTEGQQDHPERSQ